MKIKPQLRLRKFAPLLLVAILFVQVGCDEAAAPGILQAGPIQMNGANHVPAVATTGSGVATVSYDRQKKTISYTINWVLGTGSITTLMHFHGSPTGSP
ncbi:MAG: CHRD domain-containing protein, partial [Ferruginibacter sp.]|nr:CHRD domain-containing protein [Cytophagales bacterium]